MSDTIAFLPSSEEQNRRTRFRAPRRDEISGLQATRAASEGGAPKGAPGRNRTCAHGLGNRCCKPRPSKEPIRVDYRQIGSSRVAALLLRFSRRGPPAYAPSSEGGSGLRSFRSVRPRAANRMMSRAISGLPSASDSAATRIARGTRFPQN
jgi:hypothetical protein